ncbi:hypothetical protein AZE42_13004, partial [Rhizopogon vesiculosus]
KILWDSKVDKGNIHGIILQGAQQEH